MAKRSRTIIQNNIEDNTITQDSKPVLISLIICMAAIAAYRLVMIATFLSKYVDDDQAAMWYGTVLASHGGLKEPHFLGQCYGSMMESIVAVPMYMARVPLEWALPLATFLIWFFPFVLLALLCRKKMPVISFAILLSSLLYHWDYDILTNIPRGFISGFPLAFLGLGLIVAAQKEKPWKLIIGIILMGLAYINTVTTIAVSALAILYLLLYKRSWLKRNWWALLAGVAVVIPTILYCNKWFYEKNPDYWIFGSPETINLSWEIFLNNMKQLQELLCSYSLFNVGGIPVGFYLGALVAACLAILLLKRKDYRFLIIAACALLGSVIFMAVTRTKLFDYSLWYSASRLYLYFPYVVITVLFLYACKCNSTKLTEITIPVFKGRTIQSKSLYIAFVLIIVVISGAKIWDFSYNVVNNTELYTKSPIIELCSVEDVYRMADEISDFAEREDADIVISIAHDKKGSKIQPISGNKCIDYATSAINYEKYTEYRSYFDRRTGIYLKLKEKTLNNENVAYIRIDGEEIAESYVKTLNGTDCITDLENETGLRRSATRIDADLNGFLKPESVIKSHMPSTWELWYNEREQQEK